MNDSISIANQNATRLAHLSVVFCLFNGFPSSQEFCQILAAAVMSNVMKWYEDNGRTDFNPQTELICDDAIKAAFERVQQIAVLASISAQTGIGMEGLNL